MPDVFDRGGGVLRNYLASKPVSVFEIATLPELNSVSNGLRAGETSVIAGFTKHGKSALCEQLALDLSLEHSVLYMPLEMGLRKTWLRMAAKLAKCSEHAIEKHGLDFVTEGELNMRKFVMRAPEPGQKWTMREIELEVKKSGCQIVVLDHLRHIDGWLPPHSVATEIAHKIVGMAHNLGVHVIQAAQLKPDGFGKPPGSWTIHDAPSVSQLTSFELLVNRPYFGQGPAKDNIVELIARGNRNGPACTIHARWVGETQTMWHISQHEFETQFSCPCKDRKARRSAAS